MQELVKIDIGRFEDRIFAEFQQGERDSRVLLVEPRLHGEPYIIPDGVKAKIQYDKPDRKTITKNVEITDNKVVIPFTEQMCTTEGICVCKISFYTDTQFDSSGNVTQEITILKSALFKIKIAGS